MTYYCDLFSFSTYQILCIYDALSEIDLELVAKFVAGLQQPDGSFFGDKWGEVDTRFSFCAVAVLSLIVSNLVIICLSGTIEMVTGNSILFAETLGCDKSTKSH